MDYLVSARKWRPQAFDEVMGQQHVSDTLTSAIRQERIAHAYLFSGGRGVGKTTMARILSKALNCQSGPTPTPCQTCSLCESITSGSSTDVFEIDGASNRGIDEIRELRETVRYSPMQGRYKVYIIDEVHMLTKEAFNALLKTLEEPPSHVIFILATTEAHKIPSTILSRCQHFQFRRMTRKGMMVKLLEVAEKDGVKLTGAIASILAGAADGSMRDALSLLDQAIAYSGKELKEDEIQGMLGTPRVELISQMVTALKERKTVKGLEVIKTVLDDGYDLKVFAGQLVAQIRNLLVCKLAEDSRGLIDLPEEEVQQIGETASVFSLEELELLFGVFVQSVEALRIAAQPRFILEMAVIKAIELPSLQSIDQMIQKVDALAPGSSDQPSSPTSKPSQTPQSLSVDSDSVSVKNPEPQSHPSASKWGEVLARIQNEKPSLASYLERGTVVTQKDDGITLGFSDNEGYLVDLIGKEENQNIIRKALNSFWNQKAYFKLCRLESETVHSDAEDEVLKRQQMRKKAATHPIVKEALNLFGGEVVEVTKRSSPSGP